MENIINTQKEYIYADFNIIRVDRIPITITKKEIRNLFSEVGSIQKIVFKDFTNCDGSIIPNLKIVYIHLECWYNTTLSIEIQHSIMNNFTYLFTPKENYITNKFGLTSLLLSRGEKYIENIVLKSKEKDENKNLDKSVNECINQEYINELDEYIYKISQIKNSIDSMEERINERMVELEDNLLYTKKNTDNVIHSLFCLLDDHNTIINNLINKNKKINKKVKKMDKIIEYYISDNAIKNKYYKILSEYTKKSQINSREDIL